MAGGGVYGKVAGIVHIITTGVGVIITASHVFIMMWTQDGEGTTETVTGTGTGGTTDASLTNNFNGTGEAGIIIVIGNGEAPGAYRIIIPSHYIRNRSYDNNGKCNTTRGLMSSDISRKNHHRLSNNTCSRNTCSRRTCKTRGNHKTYSLKENMKERVEDMESRMTGCFIKRPASL
jgi:hypothetical protein